MYKTLLIAPAPPAAPAGRYPYTKIRILPLQPIRGRGPMPIVVSAHAQFASGYEFLVLSVRTLEVEAEGNSALMVSMGAFAIGPRDPDTNPIMAVCQDDRMVVLGSDWADIRSCFICI
jgi:hypothetical protein